MLNVVKNICLLYDVANYFGMIDHNTAAAAAMLYSFVGVVNTAVDSYCILQSFIS